MIPAKTPLKTANLTFCLDGGGVGRCGNSEKTRHRGAEGLRWAVGCYIWKSTDQLQSFYMSEGDSNLLERVIAKIHSPEHYMKILERQEISFDFKAFRIDLLTPERVLTIHAQNILKYEATAAKRALGDSWFENEKRIFVWFMVMLTYASPRLLADHKKIDFDPIAEIFYDRDPLILEFHYLNIIRVTKKMEWDAAKDAFLTAAVHDTLQGQWYEVSKRIFAVSQRQVFITSKHCRQRWLNHLDANKIRGQWTLEEDLVILEAVVEGIGKKWSKMVPLLGQKRTEHMIKNRFKSLIIKNKGHRLEREKQIARKLLAKLRLQPHSEQQLTENMIKRERSDSETEKNVQEEGEKLKVQNYSSHSEEERPFQPALPMKNEAVSPVEVRMEVKEQVGGWELKVQAQERLPEKVENNYFYDQYNYEYELYNYNNQIYQMHKTQMLYYQQMMQMNPAPTSDTHMNVMEGCNLFDQQPYPPPE